MSFKVHMHSLGVLTHPALDVTGLGPLTAEAAVFLVFLAPLPARPPSGRRYVTWNWESKHRPLVGCSIADNSSTGLPTQLLSKVSEEGQCSERIWV